jgi:hypothetical protein
LTSSPLTAPLFSDSVGSSSSGSTRKLRKKVRFKLGPDAPDDEDDLLLMQSLKISSMNMRLPPPLHPLRRGFFRTTNIDTRRMQIVALTYCHPSALHYNCYYFVPLCDDVQNVP